LLGTLKILIIFNFLITAVIIFWVMLHLKPSKPSWLRLKPYLMYGLPLIPNISLQWLVSNSGRYFIAHYQDLEHVGIYAAYCSLGRMISFFYTPLTFALYPALSKFWEESKFEEARKWVSHTIRLFLFVSVPTVFGLTYVAPYILNVLAGSQFSEYGTAILLLSSGFLCLGIYQVYVYMLHMNEKTVWILILFIFIALLNIGLNRVMVPSMGIKGAALATFVSYGIQAVSLYVVADRVNKLDFPFIFFLKTMISAGIMYAGIQIIRPDRIIEIVPVILLAGFFYFILMLVFKGIRKEDRDIIRKTLKINNRYPDDMSDDT
jgi:O-antigen/teichoic acid export membrane protein